MPNPYRGHGGKFDNVDNSLQQELLDSMFPREAIPALFKPLLDKVIADTQLPPELVKGDRPAP